MLKNFRDENKREKANADYENIFVPECNFCRVKETKKVQNQPARTTVSGLMYKLPSEPGSNSKSFRDNGSIPGNPSQSKKKFVSQN